MVRDLDGGSLRQALLGLFQVPVRKKKVEGRKREDGEAEPTRRPSLPSAPPESVVRATDPGASDGGASG